MASTGHHQSPWAKSNRLYTGTGRLYEDFLFLEKGPFVSHLKLGLPAGLGCCSSGPWAASWRCSMP